MAKETDEKQERAERILAAAAELLVRHGYNRVTIDDIAAKAEIGKGTVYLHWKTKEALFGTLFLREMIDLERKSIERLRADAHEVMPHRVYASAMLDAARRPIGWALLTGDREMMGKLFQTVLGKTVLARGLEYRAWVFRFWRENGLLDADADPESQMYAIRATHNGFLQMESRPDKVPLPIEVKVDAFARTIRRAFEPATPPSPEVLCSVAATIAETLERLVLDLTQEMDAQVQS